MTLLPIMRHEINNKWFYNIFLKIRLPNKQISVYQTVAAGKVGNRKLIHSLPTTNDVQTPLGLYLDIQKPSFI